MSLPRPRISVMPARPPIRRSAATRQFVDAVLGELAAGGYRPRAWLRLGVRSGRRASELASRRPRASADVSLLHLGLLAGGRPLWSGISWLLAWTHVGMLHDDDRGLGVPSLLTLLRADLPVWARWLGPWVALPALASDLGDGWLARRRSGETAFGAYADALADAAFWTWYAHRYEPSRRLRLAAAGTWLAPVMAIGAGYLVTGGSIDFPRPGAARLLSAGLQTLLTVRALRRLT